MKIQAIIIEIGFFVLICITAGVYLLQTRYLKKDRSSIKVGILHSRSGSLAISEAGVIDAYLMAIDEINAAGGILGKKIEPIIYDGKSDPAIFEREARALITLDLVDVIFGCWSSSSRKAVKKVVEDYNHLLIYPTYFEGLEESPNIVYTGATANQQIIPGLIWCVNNLGKKIFLIGSDYLYPRASNAIIKDYSKIIGATIVGEIYTPIGETMFADVVNAIKEAKPDVILNTLVGESNDAFFDDLKKVGGITSAQIPCLAFALSEQEISTIDTQFILGHYACASYFQSTPTAANKNFIERFKKKFGSQRTIGEVMETAYYSMYLWAQAAEQAQSSKPRKIIPAIKNQGRQIPEGLVYVDPVSLYTWNSISVGKVNTKGQFVVVYTSLKNIFPVPYPPTRTREQWETFLQELYDSWGGHWQGPIKGAV